MKKSILALLIIFGAIATVSAQIKKNTTKINIPAKAAVSPEEQVKNNAVKWFKEVYVETYFKDPYSFKLLKLTSEKVNVRQSLLDSLVFLDGELAKSKLPENERNQKTRDQYQVLYEKSVADIKIEEENLRKLKDSEDGELYQKKIAIHKKYGLIFLGKMEDYDLLVLNSNEKKRIQNKITSITSEQENQLAFYKIKIDCYSKNSLGNEVLGRFEFPFTDKGISGKVVQLNQE